MTSQSLNYYDYTLLVEQSVLNYYANLGKYLPNEFKKREKVFYLELLGEPGVGKTNAVLDKKNKLVFNTYFVIENMKNYVTIHNKTYKGRKIYRLTLTFSSLSRTYNMLREIFEMNYNIKKNYREALRSVYNYIEIWDQTYMVGADEKGQFQIDTAVLFMYNPKGDMDTSDYIIPIVLYDNQLGNFLGIPQKYWKNMKTFTLDCRSNLFLEIMKRWDKVLVKIDDCVDEDRYAQCRRVYTRTKDPLPIWGSCPTFNQKVKTLDPKTILFKNVGVWERENQRFKGRAKM